MNLFKKTLDVLFLVTMLLYVALAAVIVMGQALALFQLDGGLCLWFKDTFLVPACAVCSATGIIAFIMSYVHHWKSED